MALTSCHANRTMMTLGLQESNSGSHSPFNISVFPLSHSSLNKWSEVLWRNHCCIHLQWFCKGLSSEGLSHLSSLWFQIRKLAQVWQQQEIAFLIVTPPGPLLYPTPPVLPFSGCGCQGVPSLDAHLFCLKDIMLCFHNSLQIKTLCLSLSLADQCSHLASNGEAPPPDLDYW